MTPTNRTTTNTMRPSFLTVVSESTRKEGQLISGMASKKLAAMSPRTPTKTRIMKMPTASAGTLTGDLRSSAGASLFDGPACSGVLMSDSGVTSVTLDRVGLGAGTLAARGSRPRRYFNL